MGAALGDTETTDPKLPKAVKVKRWPSGPDLGSLPRGAPWWAHLIANIILAGVMGGGVASYRLAELESDVDRVEELLTIVRIEIAANHGKPRP